MNELIYQKTCEKWGVFEVAISGKSDGNPFLNEIFGYFSGDKEERKVRGFYDGDGIYRVRFMPSFEGKYHFSICGDFSAECFEGSFEVTAPQSGNHGPVHIVNTYHFDYADGTPYYSLGTTCYVWHLQSLELQKKTLETLKNSPFNKIRFCVFPKHYDYNLTDPITFPYEGTPCSCSELTSSNFWEYGCKNPEHHRENPNGNKWDFTRFNVKHFQFMEQNILKLCEMNIQADLILFHPYDRWGFSVMTPKEDDFYLRYVTARFAAFRNVWWSMANEFDLMPWKKEDDWDRMGRLVCSEDPYGHPRSIHNCMRFYDHTKDWITHCSMQRINLYVGAELTDEWREKYKKPVVLDEIAYEGNIQHGWGNIPAKEMVRRFWESVLRGGYPGHGETILHGIPEDTEKGRQTKLWWAHGGDLKGQSPLRIQFLSDILNEIPNGHRLKRLDYAWDDVAATIDDPLEDMKKIKDYYLFYYSFMAPSFRVFHLDDETEFDVDVIDTWEMTVTHVGCFKGKFTVPLPEKQYMAIRITKHK